MVRREQEDDSDRRGGQIVAAYNYPDLVKGCGVDRGLGWLRRFIGRRFAFRKETNNKTNGEAFAARERVALKQTKHAKTKEPNAKRQDDFEL